eukprot:TRINITY_DN74275_c0_g1_i1.p1 TRINITY_DN74275_c0_g1~~TRINITY_DN74275_c0_g1_i1.p1  ORF type:complete len:719 (-),score=145.00 TRINITY_DN74275_c0_g1_i1:143-2299(-)
MWDLAVTASSLTQGLRPSVHGPKRDVAWALRVAAAASFWSLWRALLQTRRCRDGVLPFAFRALVQGPISSTLPFAVFLSLRNVVQWLRARGERSVGSWLKTSSFLALRVWVVLEVLHYIRFRLNLNRLNRRRHLQPRLRQGEGRRMKLLMHSLQSLDTVASSQPGERRKSSTLKRRRKPDGASLLSGSRRASESVLPSISSLARQSSGGQLPLSSSVSSLSNLCQGFRRWSRTAGPSNAFEDAAGLTQAPSAEALLRSWDQLGLAAGDEEEEQEKLLQLKRADFSGWFCGADVSLFQRGNLEEWLAEYFFEGRSPAEVRQADRGELDSMVSYVACWLGYPDMPAGRNADVRCQLLSQDPLSAWHRPLWIYSLTGCVVPVLTEMLYQRLGFVKYTSGAIQYWHRDGVGGGASASCEGATAADGCTGGSRTPPRVQAVRLPVVFCHGLGIGVLPYLDFVKDLLSTGVELFLLDLPHISLRQNSDVHSPRETVACIIDMLAAWGHSQGHFVGHSFGTMVVSWTVKFSQVVASACCLDPVCFLLVKHDILTNALYREHTDPFQVFLTYFVFRELYVANTLARNMFWQQNELWPEMVQQPLLVLLSGKDAIVPALSVRRLLRAEQGRRQELLQDAALSSSGGVRVRQQQPFLQDGHQGGQTAGGAMLPETTVSRKEDLQVAASPLEIVWYPDLVHAQFMAMPKIRMEVTSTIVAFCAGAERQS